MQELAKRIPIGTFIDHGPSVEEREQVQGFQAAYAELYGKAKHIVVKPGDKIPITGLDWRIVTSAGKVLKTPLPGGGKPNPACAAFTPKEITNDPENAQSVGSVVTLGQFRADRSRRPAVEQGARADVPEQPDRHRRSVPRVASRDSIRRDRRRSCTALQPRVAVMQNGTRKGAGTQAMPTMRSSPGLEDIWQLHWAYGAGIEQNSAGVFIANVDDTATIAGVLTAPPRGGGPGRGGRAGRPGGAGRRRRGLRPAPAGGRCRAAAAAGRLPASGRRRRLPARRAPAAAPGRAAGGRRRPSARRRRRAAGGGRGAAPRRRTPRPTGSRSRRSRTARSR